MRWLDAMIDHSYLTSIPTRLDVVGPYSRIGSVVNVVFCAVMSGIGFWAGVEAAPAFYGVLVVLAAIEVVLIRVCVRAFRGDFDGIVPDEDEDEDEDAS